MTERLFQLVKNVLAFIAEIFAGLLHILFGAAKAANPAAPPITGPDGFAESQKETANVERDKLRAAEADAATARLLADSQRRRNAVYSCDFFTIERIEKEGSRIWVFAHDHAHGSYCFPLDLDLDGSVSGGSEWPADFVDVLHTIQPDDKRASVFHDAESAINTALKKLRPAPKVNAVAPKVVVLNKFNRGTSQ